MSKFKPVHLIHLLIFAPTLNDNKGGITPIIGRTRLMKMLFLFEKEIYKDFCKDNASQIDFGFSPYNYGPYSKKIYEAIDFLEIKGIIDIAFSTNINESDFDLENFLNLANENESNFDVSEEEIRVEVFLSTNSGIAIMKDKNKQFSWVALSDNQKHIVSKFKTQMVNARLKDILRYVYEKYPKYSEKSLIKNQLYID
jgi:hypothetical protein